MPLDGAIVQNSLSQIKTDQHVLLCVYAYVIIYVYIIGYSTLPSHCVLSAWFSKPPAIQIFRHESTAKLYISLCGDKPASRNAGLQLSLAIQMVERKKGLGL